MNRTTWRLPRYLYSLTYAFGMWAALVSCSMAQYEMMAAPDYDHLVGKSFSESIYLGRQDYKVIRKTPTLEELEKRRSDGCILVFGVRKKDDVIEYWRIDSGVGSCPTRKAPLNR